MQDYLYHGKLDAIQLPVLAAQKRKHRKPAARVEHFGRVTINRDKTHQPQEAQP